MTGPKDRANRLRKILILSILHSTLLVCVSIRLSQIVFWIPMFYHTLLIGDENQFWAKITKPPPAEITKPLPRADPSIGAMKNVKQWCSPQVCEVKHMPQQGSMWGFVKKLPQDFPQANLRPISLRFAFGKSFGSFLTKLSHMDPCLGMCFTSPTFVPHHCLYFLMLPTFPMSNCQLSVPLSLDAM